jgi:hypothetical protein
MDEKKSFQLLAFRKEPEAQPTTLLKAGDGLFATIRTAQRILADHVHPEGISQVDTINRLLALLDGPKCRKAAAVWNASVAESKNPKGT